MSSSELSRQDTDKQACKHSTSPGRGSTKKLSPSQKAKPDRTLYTSLSAREVDKYTHPSRLLLLSAAKELPKAENGAGFRIGISPARTLPRRRP